MHRPFKNKNLMYYSVLPNSGADVGFSHPCPNWLDLMPISPNDLMDRWGATRNFLGEGGASRTKDAYL